MNRKELKRQSREQLKHNLGILFLCTLIVGAISALPSLLMEESTLIGLITSIIITPPLSLGTTMVYLDISYGKQPEITTLFLGFRQFGQCVLSSLLLFFIALLFTIFASIPAGIIAIYSIVGNSWGFLVVYYLLFTIITFILLLPYTWIFYVMAENTELSAVEVLKESRRIMKGHMGEYIVLQLSFLPWLLLYAVVIGIGCSLIFIGYSMFFVHPAFFIIGLGLIVIAIVFMMVYLIPYMTLANTNFYHLIRGATESSDNYRQNVSAYQEEGCHQNETFYQPQKTDEANFTSNSVAVTEEPVIEPEPAAAESVITESAPPDENKLPASSEKVTKESSASSEEIMEDTSSDDTPSPEEEEEEWSWDNL